MLASPPSLGWPCRRSAKHSSSNHLYASFNSSLSWASSSPPGRQSRHLVHLLPHARHQIVHAIVQTARFAHSTERVPNPNHCCTWGKAQQPLDSKGNQRTKQQRNPPGTKQLKVHLRQKEPLEEQRFFFFFFFTAIIHPPRFPFLTYSYTCELFE